MDVVALLHSGWLLPVLAVLVALDAPFPVVPSEPLLMTASAVAVGTHDLPVAAGLFVAALLGSVTGDLLMYGLGRSSRRLSEPGDAGLARWVRANVERRPAVTIVGARFLPGGRLVSTVAAGRYGLALPGFLPWSLVSSTAWSGYMMSMGLLLGPLTGGDPLRGLLAGLVMAGVTGGTFALVRRVRQARRRRPVPGEDRREAHLPALAGAVGCGSSGS
jgi:membrane-associated protein